MIFQILTYLKMLFSLLLILQKEYGPSTPRLSILWSISRVGETLIVIEILKDKGLLNDLKIGKNSRAWSRVLNAYFLTKKFRKSPIKVRAHENSWIGLTKERCQLLKLSSIMSDPVLKSKIFGKHFIQLSI